MKRSCEVRSRGVRSLRRWSVVAALAFGSSGVAGCTAARDTLGTNSSPCFRALALAADAVHDRGVFTGVRLVSDSTVAKVHGIKAILEQRSTTRLHNVCLVSYRGDYRATQVRRFAGKVPTSGVGHFAVVVVSTPQNVLLATFVLQKEPVRFRHLALGGPGRGSTQPQPSGLG